MAFDDCPWEDTATFWSHPRYEAYRVKEGDDSYVLYVWEPIHNEEWAFKTTFETFMEMISYFESNEEAKKKLIREFL